MKFILIIVQLFGLLISPIEQHQIGEVVDSYNGVSVYYNGSDYIAAHGLNYATDGYCYGQKWQCVEFVVRYYDQALRHRFPSNYGHARDFWNLTINQGEKEESRNLYQYYNDDREAPQVNDIMVFPFSKYGHVGIITKIEQNKVEIIQQNVLRSTRAIYDIKYKNGVYSVSNANGMNKPIGWLRKK